MEKDNSLSRKIFLLFTLCLLIFLLFPQNYGQAADVAEGTWVPKLDIANEISRLYKLFLPLAGILATVMIMIGGVIWLTSAGNAERIGQAKGYISGAIIGLILALFSYSILYYINPNLVNLKPIWVYQVSREENCFWNIANSTNEGDQWRACGGIGVPRSDESCAYKTKPNNSQAVCCCTDPSQVASLCGSRGGISDEDVLSAIGNAQCKEGWLLGRDEDENDIWEKCVEGFRTELSPDGRCDDLCGVLKHCYYEEAQCCICAPQYTFSCPDSILDVQRKVDTTFSCYPPCIDFIQICDKTTDVPFCSDVCAKENHFRTRETNFLCCQGLSGSSNKCVGQQ